MIELKGLLPIVATPFDPLGRVDFSSLARLIEVLPAWGADGLTFFGIAAEYYKLTDDERVEIARFAIPRCRSAGVVSVVSVTDHATEVAVDRARQWADLGADALMLLPPFFLKPGAASVDAHVRAVAAAAPDTPIMLQYAPEQTGVALPPAMLAAIGNDCPNVRDFKIESRPPGPYISRLLEIAPGVRVHVGNAGFNLIETFARGAVGLMPGCSMTDLYAKILDAMASEDRSTELDLHGVLLALLNHIRQDVEMIIRFEKHILVRRGIIASDYCRQPAYEPDAPAWSLFESLFARLEPHLAGEIKSRNTTTEAR